MHTLTVLAMHIWFCAKMSMKRPQSKVIPCTVHVENQQSDFGRREEIESFLLLL